MTDEERSAAARLMGRVKSDKKKQAVAENLKEARKERWTPEARAEQAERMRQIQAKRRQDAEWAKRAQAAEASGYVGTETAMGLVRGDKEE